MRTLFLASLALLSGLLPGLAQDSPQPAEWERGPIRLGDPAADGLFWPDGFGADADPTIPPPESFLRAPVGSRLASHEEVLDCFRAWAELSDRMQLFSYGRTHEGRELVYALISGPANFEGLEQRLAQRFVAGDGWSGPAVVWLGFSIHGDETSGTDASLALAHRLLTDQSLEMAPVLGDLVIAIDPCQNPDGRERIRSKLVQMSGYVTNTDHVAMQRGSWPWGRGNHYLFDMNRDWLVGVAPETRGRWRAIGALEPEVLIDIHEMGPLDTFLFYPQADPHHPELPATLDKWQGTLAQASAKAFDANGWGYYTREWADAWAPFYTDAWASLRGAVGMLFEQAGTRGQPLVRESGELVTYRDSVRRQAVNALAQIRACRENYLDLLADHRASRAEVEQADRPGYDRVFCVAPEPDRPERTAMLEAILREQDIEFRRVTSFTLSDAVHATRGDVTELALPAGTLIVSPRQVNGRIVRAMFDFDPRMDDAWLAKERHDLERKGTGNSYDVTAWDLGRAMDLDCAWGKLPKGDLTAAEAPREAVAFFFDSPGDAYAYAVNGVQDGAPRFAALAMEAGIAVHLSDKSFTSGERRFARGSLLVRRHENSEQAFARVLEIGERAGVNVHSIGSGLSPDEGPDLGGGHFVLLERPRVAILSNDPFNPEFFGHLWHHLDVRLGIEHSILDVQQLGSLDLRRYNVLIVPPVMGSLDELLAPHAEALRAWVEGGGTLIGCGSGAQALLGEELGLSEVVLRRDALDELGAYLAEARLELAAGKTELDTEKLWSGELPAGGEAFEAGAAEESPKGRAERDEWMRRFAPEGAILRAEVDPEHWLTVGLRGVLPAFVSGSHVLLSKGSCPVRLAEAPELRLGGLLWPEARERLALSAYATVEGRGRGQVVLFASHPAFRGSYLGTARLLSNAVVYGPGAGASPPRPR